MNCVCGTEAISDRGLCELHFSEWLEDAVRKTITEYKMINMDERVLVAASGGKDSLTLLRILNPHYNVTALCIDEGIPDYREHTIKDLQRFCEQHSIPLVIKTFKEERGSTLMETQPAHPCTTCGVWRRELMADMAKEFDVIATGHNLDDEAQAILMNICKHHPMKPQPVLPGNDHFTRRVKPLYFIPEADVRRYAFIHNLVDKFTECPNAALSHRRTIQKLLENQELRRPGSKLALVHSYLKRISG